jgi:ferritin
VRGEISSEVSMPGFGPKALAELQRQLNHELSAAYAYEGLSLWCEDQNLKGFARYFLKQAGEERDHARKIIDHLLDRGVMAEFAQLAAPRTKFSSILEIAKTAQSTEEANTRGINQAYEAAVADRDYPAQVLLHWFINEQVEEEDWCAEMVDRVEKANCAGGLSDLDRHIERYLTEEVAPAKNE